MSQLSIFFLICYLGLNGFTNFAYATTKGALPEYTLKAGYLYNFALLTEWPKTVSNAMFTLCFSGTQNIHSALNSVQGKQVAGKSIEVQKLTSAAQAKQCDLVFISKTSRIKASHILRAVKGLPIMTVTDDTIIDDEDITILLRPEGKRLVFEINSNSAKRANLNIRARLLRLSR